MRAFELPKGITEASGNSLSLPMNREVGRACPHAAVRGKTLFSMCSVHVGAVGTPPPYLNAVRTGSWAHSPHKVRGALTPALSRQCYTECDQTPGEGPRLTNPHPFKQVAPPSGIH